MPSSTSKSDRELVHLSVYIRREQDDRIEALLEKSVEGKWGFKSHIIRALLDYALDHAEQGRVPLPTLSSSPVTFRTD